jgi:hypothetical protein
MNHLIGRLAVARKMLTGSQGNIGMVIQERKKLDDGRMPVEPVAKFLKWPRKVLL